jgi:hypothetical protein
LRVRSTGHPVSSAVPVHELETGGETPPEPAGEEACAPQWNQKKKGNVTYSLLWGLISGDTVTNACAEFGRYQGVWRRAEFMGDHTQTQGDNVAGLTFARSTRIGESDESARRLIHIPIIHSQAEMGSLSPTIRAMTVRRLGAQGWKRNVNLIEGIWRQIEQAIEGWRLPYPKVRLYQDGLPVCGRELEITSELAKAGSRNHQLLLRLKERGAMLMGTESAELLVQDYKLIKQTLGASDPGRAPRLEARQQERSQFLLKRRDEAIAERINRTLCAGEIGLLFLGMLHSLEGRLAEDIHVTHPLFPPCPGGNPCA